MPLEFIGTSRESYRDAADRLDAMAADLSGAELSSSAEDLFAFAGLLHKEGALRRALSDAALPAAAKAGLVDSLVGQRFSAAALDLVRGLVSARWSRPRDIVDAADTLGVQALLAGAEKDGQLDEVEDELFRFARILEREPELQVVLSDVATPADARVR